MACCPRKYEKILMEDEFMGFSTVPCDEFVTVLASKAPFRAAAERRRWWELWGRLSAIWLVL